MPDDACHLVRLVFGLKRRADVVVAETDQQLRHVIRAHAADEEGRRWYVRRLGRGTYDHPLLLEIGELNHYSASSESDMSVIKI